MATLKTVDERREDLEKMETNPYLGFIGGQILPTVNTMEKTGTVYYRTLSADVAAQTGRSPGAAPTQTLLTDSSTTFSCAEVVKRYGIVRDEVKQMGGIESADKLGGTACKRSVERAIEEAIADAVLTNATATVADILDSFITAAQTGLKAIKRYPGKKALVTSHTVFDRIMRYTEITGRFGLSSAVLQGVNAMDVISRQPDALKMLLQAIIGVDEVLVGDDAQWYTSDSAKQDRAALVVLPDPAEFSHKLDPVFGKNMLYLPDGVQPFQIESTYAPLTYVNTYDCWSWYNLKVLNTGALYILDGIDEGNATTTTTTTTTTT